MKEQEKRILPILGWELVDTDYGTRVYFPDGTSDWPSPRERQVLLAFEQYVKAQNDHAVATINT